jgi:DNA-binding transcriptional ArsR family regulator
MAKLNLPKELLQKESFKTLPAKEKEEYLSNLLKKILELNREGVTLSQIKEAAGLTYSTIWHHLEVLSCTAQCHKISRGNLDIYYPTGKSTHLNDYTKGKVCYSISTVENNDGKFVCIHEKRENRMGNQTVCSGIQIPLELIDDFIKTFSKVKSKSKGVTAEELLKEGLIKEEEKAEESEKITSKELLEEGTLKKKSNKKR